MQLIYTFLALLGGFLIIGTIAAVHINRHPEERESKPEELPRVIVTQEVPSVFDTFKGGKK